jgi:hypothetical protein
MSFVFLELLQFRIVHKNVFLLDGVVLTDKVGTFFFDPIQQVIHLRIEIKCLLA